MCVDVDRILGKSWWPDVCHLSQGAHTPYTRGIPWVKSPERVRLTGGRACWRERGHSYRSISSYRKLPPPACPGTTCILCRHACICVYIRVYIHCLIVYPPATSSVVREGHCAAVFVGVAGKGSKSGGFSARGARHLWSRTTFRAGSIVDDRWG